MARSGHIVRKRQGAISVFSLKSFKEKWGGRMEKEVKRDEQRKVKKNEQGRSMEEEKELS